MVIPNTPTTAYEWAMAAWGEDRGVGITVPVMSLQAVLTRLVELEGLQAAVDQKIKITIETQGESVQGAA